MSNITPGVLTDYPKAGQDNDTQGFRDNFSLIEQNFAVAKLEIDELASKAVLKSALDGSTLNNNFNGNNIVEANLLNVTKQGLNVDTSGEATQHNLEFNVNGYNQYLKIDQAKQIQLSGFPGVDQTLTVTGEVNLIIENSSASASKITFTKSGTEFGPADVFLLGNGFAAPTPEYLIDPGQIISFKISFIMSTYKLVMIKKDDEYFSGTLNTAV